MTIRIALLAAACLGVAGCTPSATNLGGVMSSMRADEPPPRTCRNVTADVVMISARASSLANLTGQEPRIGPGGITEVSWPTQGVANTPIILDLMARMKAESELVGCPIAFREFLPPAGAVSVAVAVPPPAPDAAPAPAARSAWNAPGAAPAVPGPPVAPVAAAVRPTVPAAPSAVPATASVPPKAAAAPAKPASKPVERTVSQPQPAPVPAPAVAPAPAPKKTVAVDQAPKKNVRSIPIVPAAAPDPTP